MNKEEQELLDYIETNYFEVKGMAPFNGLTKLIHAVRKSGMVEAAGLAECNDGICHNCAASQATLEKAISQQILEAANKL